MTDKTDDQDGDVTQPVPTPTVNDQSYQESDPTQVNQQPDGVEKLPDNIVGAIAWRNRQRMAYIALFAAIAVMFALFFISDPARIDKIGNIATWFFVSMASIVAAFFGWRTYSNIHGRN